VSRPRPDAEALREIHWLWREQRHLHLPADPRFRIALDGGYAELVSSPEPKWARENTYALIRLTERGKALL
jgi:hypothetical protein